MLVLILFDIAFVGFLMRSSKISLSEIATLIPQSRTSLIHFVNAGIFLTLNRRLKIDPIAGLQSPVFV